MDKMVRAIAKDYDKIITDAIEAHTGAPLDMVEAARLGKITVMPNMVEVFSYGGVDLLEIGPIEFGDSDPHQVKATRKVRNLAPLARKEGHQ
jgi:hypothetical protein